MIHSTDDSTELLDIEDNELVTEYITFSNPRQGVQALPSVNDEMAAVIESRPEYQKAMNTLSYLASVVNRYS